MLAGEAEDATWVNVTDLRAVALCYGYGILVL
jgi:hypothetical protein